MKNIILLFFIGFAVAFGGGYIFYQSGTQNEMESAEDVNQQPSEDAVTDTTDESETTFVEGEIFIEKSCIGCHAISALEVEGSAMGADLSNAYNNVEGKFGMPLEEFLRAPSSAVMSGVMAENPLSDEEIEQVVEALRVAASQ